MRPFADARQAHPQPPGHGLFFVTLGAEQDNPRTQTLALGCGAGPHSALQFGILFGGEVDRVVG